MTRVRVFTLSLFFLAISTQAFAQNAKLDACVKGYKGAIEKYALTGSDVTMAEAYCNVITTDMQGDRIGDLMRLWAGLDYSLMVNQAFLQGEEQGLIATCKTGAYTAIGDQDDALKKKDVTRSIAVHEVCVGPLKEGSIIEKTKVYPDGSLMESYQLKRVKGEFVKDGMKTSYHKDGKIQAKVSYKSGDKDGKVQYFDKDGKMIEETTFKKDKRHGDYTKWDHKTHKVIETGKYKNDEKDGLWVHSDKDGKKEKEITFDKGEVKNKTTY